eukprot:COSAG03_NODE_28219_length_214_cov_16.434783_1_plen_35_part_10
MTRATANARDEEAELGTPVRRSSLEVSRGCVSSIS